MPLLKIMLKKSMDKTSPCLFADCLLINIEIISFDSLWAQNWNAQDQIPCHLMNVFQRFITIRFQTSHKWKMSYHTEKKRYNTPLHTKLRTKYRTTEENSPLSFWLPFMASRSIKTATHPEESPSSRNNKNTGLLQIQLRLVDYESFFNCLGALPIVRQSWRISVWIILIYFLASAIKLLLAEILWVSLSKRPSTEPFQAYQLLK